VDGACLIFEHGSRLRSEQENRMLIYWIGVVSAPTATGSPITYSNGGSVKGASAIGMIVAGGVALVSPPASSVAMDLF
jgi:hypothetical protein